MGHLTISIAIQASQSWQVFNDGQLHDYHTIITLQKSIEPRYAVSPDGLNLVGFRTPPSDRTCSLLFLLLGSHHLPDGLVTVSLCCPDYQIPFPTTSSSDSRSLFPLLSPLYPSWPSTSATFRFGNTMAVRLQALAPRLPLFRQLRVDRADDKPRTKTKTNNTQPLDQCGKEFKRLTGRGTSFYLASNPKFCKLRVCAEWGGGCVRQLEVRTKWRIQVVFRG